MVIFLRDCVDELGRLTGYERQKRTEADEYQDHSKGSKNEFRDFDRHANHGDKDEYRHQGLHFVFAQGSEFAYESKPVRARTW